MGYPDPQTVLPQLCSSTCSSAPGIRVQSRPMSPAGAPFGGAEKPSRNQLLFVIEKILIRDKLAYPGSLSASLSQELIAAYPWLAYPVAYPVVASWRCGQRLGGGRRLGGAGFATAAFRSRFGGWPLGGRRLGGGGGGLATAAPRSQLGVVLSFSLSFSLSRGLSVLIRGHIQDL